MSTYLDGRFYFFKATGIWSFLCVCVCVYLRMWLQTQSVIIEAKASSRNFQLQNLQDTKLKFICSFSQLWILSLNINILTYINFSDIQNCKVNMAELLLKAHMYKYPFSIHKVFGIIITIILHPQPFAFIFTFFFTHNGISY